MTHIGRLLGFLAVMPGAAAMGQDLPPEAPLPQPPAATLPSYLVHGAGVAPRTGQSGGSTLVVPNGNGTSTIIHPDGSVETVPTPK